MLKTTAVPRRALITGALGGGAGALLLGSARHAAASGADPDSPSVFGLKAVSGEVDVSQANAVPTAIAGAQMLSIDGASFHPLGFSNADVSSTIFLFGKGARPSGSSTRLVAPLRIPPGSRILQLDYYGFRDTAGTQQFGLTRLDSTTRSGVDLTTDVLTGTGAITATRAVNILLAPGNDYVVYATTANTEPYVTGVIVQYTPPTGAFYPIAPKRVYDSRVSGGRLSDAAERTISVATELGTANVVVPSGARAVATNLAVTETSGAGFASMRPSGTTWDNTASINWSGSGETLSNGVTSTLGGDRQVTVLVGGVPGVSTHFIVDVVGYYL